MSAAEDLFRQALALPEEERRALVARLAATLPDDDGIELDPAELAEAASELEAHRADPSTALSADEARAWLAARRTG